MKIINTLFTLSLALLTYFYSPQTQALDRFNLAQMTCATELTENEEAMLVVWIDGYLAAKANKTGGNKIEMKILESFLVHECTREGSQTLLTIADKYHDYYNTPLFQ